MARISKTFDIDHLIKLYQSGVSRKQLGKQFGIHTRVVNRTLIQHGITPADHRTRIIPEDAAQWYIEGMSEKSIADRLSVSRSCIHRFLLDREIQRRDQISANRLMMAGRTREENIRNVRAANEAAKIRLIPEEEKIRRAVGRQIRPTNISDYERILDQWLRERGIEMTSQLAVYKYNLDLATFPVAVEVFGGSWHQTPGHIRKARERFPYLFYHGWNVVIVWVDKIKKPLTIACADYIASFVETVRLDPTIRGQYRVIWGNGQDVTAKCPDLDSLTRRPSFRNCPCIGRRCYCRSRE